MGEDAYGINKGTIDSIVDEISKVVATGVQLAIVIGGGNIFRGVALGASGMDRATADYMGMIATVMNALALQDAMRQKNIEARVQSALRIDQVVEPYIRPKAIRYLEEGKALIFAAGTGNPYFTTDSAASLRAIEIRADLLLKATKVNGVYSADPVTNPHAILYERISYDAALEQKLGVMDATALVLCSEHGMPLRVFNVFDAGQLGRIVAGEDVGTLVQ